MNRITAHKICIEFPLYDRNNRSLRHLFMGARNDRRVRFKQEGEEGELEQLGARIHVAPNGVRTVKALDNVSFSIKEGDHVGLLGRNGAGKTTLLRAMAGIYEPSSGSMEIVGNITPMFALDAGMDPDSTGYENIGLRARILGFSNELIESRREEIAEFTELGDYLHMPIRTYSAGMMVRLSFAISTAVAPDILLMDEMIGAGDAGFVDRADERLESFIGEANIMVVATHSAGIIKQWCNKAMLLEKGRVKAVGPIDDIVKLYEIDLALGKDS